MSCEKSLLHEYSKYSNHLGNYYPFFIESDDSQELFLDMKSALEKGKGIRNLDFVGVVEIINCSFLLGNRTLVQGIKRLPWMSSFNSFNLENSFIQNIPQHNYIDINPDEVAKKLKDFLVKELQSYINDKKNIGILLSGGLDSRIVAGLIKEMQLQGKYEGNVVSITWGLEQSRDVIYAKDISERYGWENKHLNISQEVLRENIYLAGKMGAEFSPCHLHAMSKIKDLEGIDAIIAGSYGDSVGRGEFSGRHVLKLKPIVGKKMNVYGIMRDDAVRKAYNHVLNDAYSYRKKVYREKEYQYREIEQEMHYMRRKLQACMNIIGDKIPLYQLFTSPETFGLMWSIDPKKRSNLVYKEILHTLPGDVYNIPWARNGRTIDGGSEYNKIGLKHHHKYGKWLRNELSDEILKLVLSDEIMELGLFNHKNLRALLRVWKKQDTNTINKLDEIFSWIASLAVFISEYNISNKTQFRYNLKDKLNYFPGILSSEVYCYLRGKLRE